MSIGLELRSDPETIDTMNGVRTKRQAAKADKMAQQDVISNGNGEVHKPTKPSKESSENIFLFYPNIIGM